MPSAGNCAVPSIVAQLQTGRRPGRHRLSEILHDATVKQRLAARPPYCVISLSNIMYGTSNLLDWPQTPFLRHRCKADA